MYSKICIQVNLSRILLLASFGRKAMDFLETNLLYSGKNARVGNIIRQPSAATTTVDLLHAGAAGNSARRMQGGVYA